MRLTALTLAGVVALSALSSATQSTTRGAGNSRYVAIGCVSRDGTAAAPRYLLTDSRGDRPTVYRLTGDAALLAAHVGHSVEVAGSITSAPAARGSASSPTLKVDSLVWLSTSCTAKK